MKGIFYSANRLEWRKWLFENFETRDEIWFVFSTKDSGEDSVSYNDAVEEALCFGCIDGRAGTLDGMHSIRRFTLRRKRSGYSRPNIERLIWLEEHGMIHPKIRDSILPITMSLMCFRRILLMKSKKTVSLTRTIAVSHCHTSEYGLPILMQQENAPRSFKRGCKILFQRREKIN